MKRIYKLICILSTQGSIFKSSSIQDRFLNLLKFHYYDKSSMQIANRPICIIQTSKSITAVPWPANGNMRASVGRRRRIYDLFICSSHQMFIFPFNGLISRGLYHTPVSPLLAFAYTSHFTQRTPQFGGCYTAKIPVDLPWELGLSVRGESSSCCGLVASSLDIGYGQSNFEKKDSTD